MAEFDSAIFGVRGTVFRNEKEMLVKVIEVRNLCKTYGSNKGRVSALKDVSFKLEDKGFVFIVGKSGSGKTTLMNLMTGLDSPTGGEIIFGSKNVEESTESEWNRLRNCEIGIVFQDYLLFDERSVYDNILISIDCIEFPSSERKKLIENALDYVGILELKDKKCRNLSAGQKQRVAIARAIVKNPRILFADEATGNLDEENAGQVLEILNEIAKNSLVVLICHNEELVNRYADYIIKLEAGELASFSDNRDIKQIARQGLWVTDENETVRESLEKFSLIRFVAKKTCGNPVEQSMNVNLKVSSSGDMSEQNRVEAGEKRARRLPFKSVINRGLSELLSRRGKALFSILIISLFGMISMFVHVIKHNDYGRLIDSYIRGCDYVYVFFDSDYQDGLNSGQPLLEKLSKAVGEENIFRVKEDAEIELGNRFYSCKIAYNDNTMPQIALLSGRWFDSENSCVVSKELAEQMGAEEGTKILVEETELQLIGIADVGGAFCFVPKETREKVPELESCSFFAVDVALSSDAVSYANKMTVVGKKSAAEAGKCELLDGRFPQKDNEVTISRKLAETEFSWPERKIVQFQRLPDLYDDDLNLKYGHVLNLSDYTGRNVEIVGIYDDSVMEENFGDIIFTDYVFESLVSDYLKYFGHDSLIVLDTDKKNGLFEKLDEAGVRISFKNSHYIYDTRKVMQSIKTLTASGMVFCSCVLVLVMSVLCVSWIKEAGKKIGILRSIGYSAGDINSVFLVSGGVIVLTSAVLSIALYFFSVHIFNFSFGKVVGDPSIAVIGGRFAIPGANACAMALLGIGAMTFKLLRFGKTKVIDLTK